MGWTIYCHTHTETCRRYIGLTKLTMMKRWNRHVYSASQTSDGRSYFANAIRKYGKDAFSHEVLESCSTLEEANLAEQKWIAHFKTRDPEFGFNIACGGGFRPNPEKRNPWDRPEFREKVGSVLKDAWSDPARAAEFRKRNHEALRTPEVRQRQSATLKKVRSEKPELWANNIAGFKGKKHSEGTRAKLSASNKTWERTPEMRVKISAALKGRDLSPEARLAAVEAMRGKPLDVVHRSKVSAGVRAYFDLSKRSPCSEEKACVACGLPRPLNWFRKNKRRKDGLSTRCAECDRRAFEAWKARRTA